MNELNFNKNFRQEMIEILADNKRKEQLVNALMAMQAKLKQNQSPVLDFLLNR